MERISFDKLPLSSSSSNVDNKESFIGKWKNVVYISILFFLIFLVSFLLVMSVGDGILPDAKISSNKKSYLQTLTKPYGKIVGTTLLNKGYNLIGGHGFDATYANVIGEFTTGKKKLVTIGDLTNFLPDQMSVSSNPSCEYVHEKTSVFEGASVQATAYQANSRSFSEKIDAIIDTPPTQETETVTVTIPSSLTYGNSDITKVSISAANESYAHQFEVHSAARLMTSSVKWQNPQTPFDYDDKFKKGLKSINSKIRDDAKRNRDVMNFIGNFGTHVIKRAEFGAVCRSFVGMMSSATSDEIEEFMQSDEGKAVSDPFISESEKEKYSTLGKFTTKSGFSYEISSMCCNGLIAINPCNPSMKTGIDEPVILRLEALPIFEISVDNLNLKYAKKNILSTLHEYFEAAKKCSKKSCEGKGACVPHDDFWLYGFINWNGKYDDDSNVPLFEGKGKCLKY